MRARFTLISVKELAELVQHLTDAQALLNDHYRFNYSAPDAYNADRYACIKQMRHKFFHDSRLPLTGMEDIQTEDPVTEPEAPKPDEKTIVPSVQ